MSIFTGVVTPQMETLIVHFQATTESKSFSVLQRRARVPKDPGIRITIHFFPCQQHLEDQNGNLVVDKNEILYFLYLQLQIRNLRLVNNIK